MATLVILPGWEQTKQDWTVAASNFTDLPVTVLELPGFGDTPLIDASWGIPEYAEYVMNKIETSISDEVILLGHSFGGRIASYIASLHPSWLKALILYGSPSIYRPAIKTKALSYLAKIAKKLGFSSTLSRNSELKAADQKGLGNIFRKAITFDQTELLGKITVPTLLLWGELDNEAPVQLAHEMHALIPNNKLEIIDNAGHHLHLVNQYIFYGKVKTFIENL